jgi:hypothetical protein
VEKAQNLRIVKLESRQTDPVEILCLQMQWATIGQTNTPSLPATNTQPRPTYNVNAMHSPTPNPGNMSARCQVRYVAANQSTMRPRGQPPTQEEQDAVRAHVNKLTHHPDTPGGQAAYVEQVKHWEMQWGRGTRCSEQTPYPLMPGTVQICLGECFRCSAHSHISPECQIPVDNQLLKNESIWRGLCMCTLEMFNRATVLQINIVFNDIYAPIMREQGNWNGSLV